MMMIRKWHWNVIYVVGILLSICGCFIFRSEANVISFCCLAVFVHQLVKINFKNDSVPTLLISLIVICLFSFIISYIDNKRLNVELKTYGSIVTVGVVDKVFNYRGGPSFECRYTTHLNVTINKNVNCEKQINKKLHVKDTVLIRYSKYNTGNCKIYNYFPTHTEIERFKDGVPYEDIKNDKK